MLSSRIQNQPSDSWTNLGKIVPAAIGYFFQGIGRFMLILLRFFQEFAIAGLIAVSPLLIGFLFFSYTQSLGVQFGVTSLTVLLWHVAICLVDIVIQAISDTLFMPITANNLVQVGANLIVVNNWLMFPFIMAFASFRHGLLLSLRSVRGVRRDEGSQRDDRDPASRGAGSDADRGNDGGRGADSRGSRGHIWRFRRRSGSHRGNQTAAEGATAAGRIANDLAGAGGFAPGEPASQGGGSDLPEPPRLAPAPVGESYRTDPIPPRSPIKRNRIRSP